MLFTERFRYWAQRDRSNWGLEDSEMTGRTEASSLHTRCDWGLGREVTLTCSEHALYSFYFVYIASRVSTLFTSPSLACAEPSNLATHPPLGRKLLFQASASYVCLTFVVEILLVPPVFSRLCVLRISLFPLDETMNLVTGLRHKHMACRNAAIMSNSVRIL